MQLTKDIWTQKDAIIFEKYLESLKLEQDKINWTINIVKSNKPVYAIKSNTLKDIAKQIYKGNYLSFLDLQIFSSHESTIIYGIILSKLKDFTLIKKYLDIYSLNCDSWAQCDTLSFNIKNLESELFELGVSYTKSKLTFKRRIGIIIFFKFISSNYIDNVFNIISSMKYESEYYVNMAIAWLICESFIKQREKTLALLQSNKLNAFTKNKAISKCKDSYRVSNKDKTLLNNLKQNSN